MNARPTPCARLYLSIIPAITIILLITNYSLIQFCHRWPPKWCRPFVSEESLEYPRSSRTSLSRSHRQSPGPTVLLFAFSLLAVASELVQLVSPSPDWAATAPFVSWVSQPYQVHNSVLAGYHGIELSLSKCI